MGVVDEVVCERWCSSWCGRRVGGLGANDYVGEVVGGVGVGGNCAWDGG